MRAEFTAVFQEVPEGYIGFVEELPGANTQGATLAEARSNLEEAVALVLEANRVLAEEELGIRKSSSVPRHAEINDNLARKICKDLGMPRAAD